MVDRFEEIYEKLMNALKGKQFSRIEGNDKLDEIIRNLKEFAYMPFHQKLIEGIKNAIYSKDPYVEKLPIKVTLSKRSVSVLVNIVAKDTDNFVVNEYSQYVAVYHKSRTAILLPTAIVALMQTFALLL